MDSSPELSRTLHGIRRQASGRIVQKKEANKRWRLEEIMSGYLLKWDKKNSTEKKPNDLGKNHTKLMPAVEQCRNRRLGITPIGDQLLNCGAVTEWKS